MFPTRESPLEMSRPGWQMLHTLSALTGPTNTEHQVDITSMETPSANDSSGL